MPPAGLEPATLWLEAIRAIRLRHEGKVRAAARIELATTPTQREYHTPRPSGLLLVSLKRHSDR